jgi:uncharacterized protein (TIGR00730 family)
MTTQNFQVEASQTISLADEEKVKELLVNTVYTLWDTVNNLTKLRPSKREHYRVSIFGSARAKEGTAVYEEVKRLASALSALDCDIITGGGPGLMQAANEGAVTSAKDKDRANSVGIRVKLPFEQNINQFVEKSYEHQTFFTRLHHFALASDAFVVVPGGIGTALESLMVWQLLQVKHLPQMPLIFVGKMYQELVDWAKKNMVELNQLANPEDMKIPHCVQTVEEAVSLISKHREVWLASQKLSS